MARLISHRVSRGDPSCSAETGAYCQARKRLPEEFISKVARQVGSALENNAKKQWLWKGRRVLVYDGSTVSMPDTAANQEAYPQSIILVTTMLNAEEVTADDLGEVYRARWNAELDFRSLKQTMKMDILRCKTPGLVRKEIWAHILAYNLIRTIMAQAASKHEIEPRTISFKRAIQTLEAFQPVVAIRGDRDCIHRQNLYQHILDAIATHRVADRPDRFEPRLRKRRQKKYDRMMKPRNEIKLAMRKGVSN